ncbi:polymorphic toxin-type HINT domain-containing protein [Actinomadura rubteroloni]|uniref:polymorphic toxin-type HINT domain-containing protein n=1 Tax=Actinomadura rubteroloni TaxID=1926885 RepID=UPI00143DFF33|nr:polymorphic toxin-type HINT domain-containing protein [Actinomadura rubteroloni]
MLALLLLVVLPAGLVEALPASAFADPKGTRPATQKQRKPVKGSRGKVKPRRPDPTAAKTLRTPPRGAWPSTGSTEVTVQGGAGEGTAGGLRVRVAGKKTAEPRKLRVDVLSRQEAAAAGVSGVLLRLSRTDTVKTNEKLRVSIGYGTFADAFGGAFGSHLRLIALPKCPPGKSANCGKPTELPSANDGATRTVTADLPAATAGATTMVALAADTGSDQGTYGATNLAPSSKWSVSPSSGGFSWSYPFRTVPAPGGMAPSVGLGYSSQSVDGETSATNNQGSWIGEGFSYEPGYIERRYKACADDGNKGVGDLCWATDNAVIQLGGTSTELIKDDATGKWRLKDDDGSKVERLTGATNGDDNGEHWRITTTDGTQYYFGLNRLPGWASGNEETSSVWRMPVFGNNSGEPCYKSSGFADSWCNQAWRWNLDYVKSPHGDVLSYYYAKETNYYARNAKTDVNGTPYDRGGYLKRADYGQRDGQVYSTPAAARVAFDVTERCMPSTGVTCDPAAVPDSANWPDVPGWLNCKPDTKCTWQQTGPSFWTRKRLVKIRTQMRSGTGYADVDSWTLTHEFKDNGDGSRTLWLAKIDHAGLVGGTATTPSIQLVGKQLPNRIDIPNDNIQPMVRYRLATVYTDSGGQLDVNYAPTECTSSSLPKPGESTKRCFPVKWTPPGVTDPITDWFHKYVVEKVIQTDRTGGSPDQVTKYEYEGDAGWRYTDPDGIADPKNLTWGEWAGYGKVHVLGGDGQTYTTRTDYTYFRGMDGDKDPAGGTRSVSVKDSTDTSYTDYPDLAGFELESVVYDGASIVSKTINAPWRKQTATRKNDWGTDRAGFVDTGTTRGLTALSAGGWRETKSTTTYDDTTGRILQEDDLGDLSTATDDVCTLTSYADDVDAWMRTYVKRVEKLSVKCADAGTADRSTKLLSDTLTSYDGQAYGTAPTKGDVTKVQTLKSHDGTTAKYITDAEGTFDEHGRPLTAKDPAGSTTTTEYTDTDGLATYKKETNPLGHITETWFTPGWNAPAAQIDPNGKRTDLAYDPLGRLTSVWFPDRPKANSFTPSVKYSYAVPGDGITSVKTEKIENDGTYGTEYKLLDGFLRPRQIQTEGPDGGRLVADTFYNGIGQVAKANETYWANGPPSSTLLTIDNGLVNGQTVMAYDGAGRPKVETFRVAGQDKWSTTTTYGGDRVSTQPPAGGTPSTAITDAQGRTIQLLQYKGTSPTGDHDTSTYTYTAAGSLATVTNESNEVWRYEYDQRGRRIKAVDPDAGTTTYGYDDLDRPVLTTDARNKSIFTTYDKISRKTATYEGTDANGKKLTQWTYDTKYKGQLYSTLRHTDGTSANAYGSAVLTRDDFYRPTSTRYVVPSAEGNLKGTYDFTTSYNRDGTIKTIGMPAAGDLPAEVVRYGYDDLQRPITVDGTTSYLTRTDYAPTGELLQRELSTGGKKTWQTYTYERGTNRLVESKLNRELQGAVPDFRGQYSYTDSGSITSINDAATGDDQCFSYDYLDRLSAAWTAKSDCSTAPTKENVTTTVGGPDPYWTSYTQDPNGNRRKVVQHTLTATGTDTTANYTYPTNGAARPHAVSRVVDTTPTGDRLNTYAYDEAGNTTERVLAGQKQTLTWDSEGSLASVKEADGSTSSYVYDGDGNRLIRKEPGTSTLYLPGMELRLLSSGTVEGTRYYQHGDDTIATRTKDGVTFLSADHNSTSLLAVKDGAEQTLTRRRLDPFGNARNGADKPPAWIDDKGFLGAPKDSSGLTHMGAREYDPKLGRFISVDPLFDDKDPQSWNGYSYADNDPVSKSDPDGQWCRRIDGYLECFNGDGQNRVPHPSGNGYTVYPKHGRPVNSGDVGPARNTRPAINPRIAAQKQAAEQAKQRLKAAAMALGKIAAEELGITDALDCFTKGDIGGCAETALNVVTMISGGPLLKFLRKHGNPFKWAQTFRLGKKILGLVKELAKSFNEWRNSSRLAKELEMAATCTVGNSFMPSTTVLMADGKRKRIDQINPGDRVQATDPATGKRIFKPVVATIVGHGTKNLVDITVITTSGKRGLVVATDGHPFWAVAFTPAPWRRAAVFGWVNAGSLQPGMRLRTNSGANVRVVEVRHRISIRQNVYNLSVADAHTYYVAAGAPAILVHNCGSGEITDETMNMHILRRHSLELDHRFPEFAAKTKFAEGVTPDQIRIWARAAMGAPMDKISTANGAHRHLYNAGEVVGFEGETHVAVWVEGGRVTSVHPESP